MKRILVLLVISLGFLANGFSQAESYKAFEWDILRLGYVLPSGDGVSGGLAISTEPRFNLRDDISIGLRWEAAFFGAEDVGGNETSLSAAGSFALMGDYYFKTDASNRLFAGIGVGTFSSGTVTITDSNGAESELDGGSSLGIIPRVGYEIGHLRASVEYNLLFKEGSSNYIGVHFGFTLWGGYKG